MIFASISFIHHLLDNNAMKNARHESKQVPRHLKHWHTFMKQHKCSDQFERISRDFEPFYTAIKHQKYQLRKQIQHFLSQPTHPRMHRCRIQSGQAHHCPQMVDAFAHLLPNLSVFINDLDEPRVIFSPSNQNPMDGTTDWIYNRAQLNGMLNTCRKQTPAANQHGFFIRPDTLILTSRLVPVLSQTKTDCFADILIPSEYNYYAQIVPDDIETLQQWTATQVKWEDKHPVLIWRGSTTGMSNTIEEEWRRSHRIRLVEYSRSIRRDDIDLKLTGIAQASDDASAAIQHDFPLVERLPQDAFWRNKYLMDVDGNTFSQRFFVFLFHNSLIFHAGLFVDWFSERLKPNVHYIPISLTYKDLADKVSWARQNDKKARDIAENAMRLAWNDLRKEEMQCYMFRVMAEYVELLRQLDLLE